ncbi:fibrous sheath-interacting protein 1 isoform 1-T1 [Odontesthes bonariensis]|uniref:fibrous sheath-interacting protein 1 n=1 Tax=Odontesthes bonariensis TaxID=219752 RepID=UPI003F582A37
MEIIKGSLDDISRPASSEQTGSRVSRVSLLHSDGVCPTAPFELVVLTNDAVNIQSCPGEITTESSTTGPDKDQPHIEVTGDDNGDSKLQRAFKEMRRLDEILNAKICKEKQIQRQRKALQAKLWQDLLNKPERRSECVHEALNTKLFLALEAHTGMYSMCNIYGSAIVLKSLVHVITVRYKICFCHLKGAEEEGDFVPVFETQVPYCEHDGDDQCLEQNEKRPTRLTESFEVNFEDVGDNQVKGSHCGASESKNIQKDFIKRNIELVGGEEGQVFLTHAEKERLAELLREIDEEEEDCARGTDNKEAVRDVSVLTGQGYTPEPSDLEQLIEIDCKIRRLLPIEEFYSAQSSYTNLNMSQGLGSKIGWKCDGIQQPGERVLQDIKERREQETRLQEIQQQLEILGYGQEMADESPTLTEEQLISLLGECELTESWSQDHEMNETTPMRPSKRSDLSI